jgi:hypothetical protein
MEHIHKKRRLNIFINDIVKNLDNKCLICNIYLGENCVDQLCNKTYCSNS